MHSDTEVALWEQVEQRLIDILLTFRRYAVYIPRRYKVCLRLRSCQSDECTVTQGPSGDIRIFLLKTPKPFAIPQVNVKLYSN